MEKSLWSARCSVVVSTCGEIHPLLIVQLNTKTALRNGWELNIRLHSLVLTAGPCVLYMFAVWWALAKEETVQNLLCPLTLTCIFPQFARCWWSQIAASNTLLSETQDLHYLLTLSFNYLWCVFATLCLVYSVMWLYVFSLCHVHHHL